MTACENCGATNGPGAAFCRQCHQYLWATESPIVEPAPAAEDASEGQSVRQSAAAPAQVDGIAAALDAGHEIAASRGRPDLEEHLERAREQMATHRIPVVVVGEFKQGKSTLINALLQTDVCAVDADIVTAVPTTVRYADKPVVSRYLVNGDGEHLEEQHLPLESLHSLESSRTSEDSGGLQPMVEVGLHHLMLKSGMALIDTPGVGGLDSADGQLALGALAHAEGVIFVTDAAQEMTEPELAFLIKASQRCPRMAMVMPKIDLNPHWRRIADLNRGHLERASLDLPVIPVSSLLRLRAGKDPDLNAESRFGDLVTFLARDVVAASRRNSAQSMAVEVDFVASQLQQQARAERAVIAAPERTDEVVAELNVIQQQARRLAAPTATWQLTLGDGIAKLESDVDYELQGRLRTILRETESEIDAGDPQDIWIDIEASLRRELAVAIVANRDLLLERAAELAVAVAWQFELPSGGDFDLVLETSDGVLDQIELAPASTFAVLGSRLAPVLTAARTGYLPLAIGGAFVGAAGLGVLGVAGAAAVLGLSALLGGGIGAKIFGGEMQRQRVARQQAAKNAMRKFVDEVAFVVGKQTRDSLRSTRQQLRDDFQDRARQLERSAQETAAAVQQASRMAPGQQRARDQVLAAQEHQLHLVRMATRHVVEADDDD